MSCMAYSRYQMTGLLGVFARTVRIVPAVMVSFQIVMTKSHVLSPPSLIKFTVENMDDGHRQKRQHF